MWIFFNGDEEGTDGEDGSTCAKVRFGIRQCLLKGLGIGVALYGTANDGQPTDARRRRANSQWSRAPCFRRTRRLSCHAVLLSHARFRLHTGFRNQDGQHPVVKSAPWASEPGSSLPGIIKYELLCTLPRFSLLFFSSGTYATNLDSLIRRNIYIFPGLGGECGVMLLRTLHPTSLYACAIPCQLVLPLYWDTFLHSFARPSNSIYL